jgi:hypothetical protein
MNKSRIQAFEELMAMMKKIAVDHQYEIINSSFENEEQLITYYNNIISQIKLTQELLGHVKDLIEV